MTDQQPEKKQPKTLAAAVAAAFAMGIASGQITKDSKPQVILPDGATDGVGWDCEMTKGNVICHVIEDGWGKPASAIEQHESCGWKPDDAGVMTLNYDCMDGGTKP